MIFEGDRLRLLIKEVRRRWFVTVALRAAGTALAAAAMPVLAGLGVYWFFAPSGVPLLILAAAATTLALATVVLAIVRIEPRPNDLRVARFIEERAGSLPVPRAMDDSVVSAVQAAAWPHDDARAPFGTLVVAAALRRLDGIDAAVLIAPPTLRRAAAIGAGGAALMAFALALGAPALRHAWETARLRLFPSSVSVEVQPGNARILAGRPLTITARVHAGGAALALAKPVLVVSAGAEERRVEMTSAPEGFAYTFESVDRSFRYKVVAGAASSADHAITALFAPRVKRIDLEYQYPSFTGVPPRAEEGGGDIYAPAGTRVRVRVHTDKPVVSGELGMGSGTPALRNAGERMLEADLVVARDDSYRIRLRDADGLASDGDSEYFIRVMEDRPPDVRILQPSSDQGITPLQEIGIEARAEDDYGIASLDLVYSVGGGMEHIVPFAGLTGGPTQRTGAHLLAAEDLNVRPGDVIAYYARARDVARGRRSAQATSDLFFLEVKPFNEEFISAQSQASGAAGGDPQIESLIEAQKDIISATWNIERRSAGGRSADDIRAIAKAQADLKARAERVLAEARGRRGRGFFPQRTQALIPEPRALQGAANPVAGAVAAMTKALEQLTAERTREAIPHEMSALNGLLQAQAEVRQRQITQQARGGGGGNRQSQDLSALFDKELQRQQRTNYEQRSQVEERQEQSSAGREMADRVKDLARRQEALNRERRELARMQAEERKRQLERLAREQQELQRQAGELSKQMEQRGDQGSRSQQGQQGQSQGQGNSAMRSAAEQMGRAAAGMQRDDESSAAQSGERAAEQLRNLEAQMRGTGADARQRAAADLQAEAQQIAQEQRRIASEAERIEKSGEAGDAGARRRLAADKDRLADRADNLKRGAEQLGQASPQGSARGNRQGRGQSEEQSRAREAAGELERQRIGERMRDSAQQIREGTSSPSGQAEQQIAKVLEQVVEKLGGEASADARELVSQLDKSKEIRDRLDQLEAKLKAAEGRAGAGAERDKLRQQYEQELGRARAELGRGSTPEEQQFSQSAPGTEAFKQDRSGWDRCAKASIAPSKHTMRTCHGGWERSWARTG